MLLANQTFGWDRHIYDIPMSKWGANLKIAMAAKLLFTAAATFTRLSLFTFYYRLVKDSSRQGFRWMVHLNVAYTVAIFFTFIFLGTFLCTPVHLYWTIGAEGKCLDEGAATMAAGIINVTADFLCTITPMPLVAQVRGFAIFSGGPCMLNITSSPCPGGNAQPSCSSSASASSSPS